MVRVCAVGVGVAQVYAKVRVCMCRVDTIEVISRGFR